LKEYLEQRNLNRLEDEMQTIKNPVFEEVAIYQFKDIRKIKVTTEII